MLMHIMTLPQRFGLRLEDKVANSPNELEEGGIIFGKGFGVITDMQVGPEDR
jgi:hypothetical protein